MSQDDKYYSTDIIAHYTSLDSAIKIIITKKLLLTPRSNSFDCLERIFGYDAHLARSQKRENDDYMHSEEVQQFQNQISSFYAGIKQTCFCRTVQTNKYVKTIDDLSFLHTRMWEQYADCYKGVCLLFSMDKLIKANQDCLAGDMNYKPLSHLTCVRIDEGTDIDQLRELGQEAFLPIRKQQIIQQAFDKSSDYQEEHEYRVMKLNCSKEEKDYIDIKDSLVAVVYFPSYSRERMHEKSCNEKNCNYKICEYKSFVSKQIEFIEYCKKNNIEVLRITTNPFGSIRFETEEQYDYLMSVFRSTINEEKAKNK